MAVDSLMERKRSMAAVPSMGPMASMAKAGPHPMESAKMGTSHMGTMVNKKPSPVWNARAVHR